MSAFDVELGELQAAASSMRSAADDRISQAAIAPADVSVTGDAAVTAALSTFSSAWRTGSAALTTDVDNASSSLASTALSYAQVDMAVASLLRALGVHK